MQTCGWPQRNQRKIAPYGRGKTFSGISSTATTTKHKILTMYIPRNIQVGQMSETQFCNFPVRVSYHILVWFVDGLENIKLTCCEKNVY